MKKILLIVICFVSVAASAQFHLKITCNPDHGGQVNPKWANNYVITFTNDNWRHSHLLYWQRTYEGFDNNGITFYTSYWQACSFQTQEDAFQIANDLKSQYAVGKSKSS